MTTYAFLVLGAILILPLGANMIPLSHSLRMSRAAGIHRVVRVHRVDAVVHDTLSTSTRTVMRATVAVTVITGSKQREMNAHLTTSRATSICRLRANASFEIGATPMPSGANMARLEQKVGCFLRTSEPRADWQFHMKCHAAI